MTEGGALSLDNADELGTQHSSYSLHAHSALSTHALSMSVDDQCAWSVSTRAHSQEACTPNFGKSIEWKNQPFAKNTTTQTVAAKQFKHALQI